MSTIIPNIVFIVPYRNRPEHKFFFSTYLHSILKDENVKYEIYFSHQCDTRPFNRGATKNIGFLAIKKKYPEHYKNITFVFNDIDTLPFSHIFNYKTEAGNVKHFYGFKYALGGMVSFKGSDFERTKGYPNFWGWGMEDTVLQKRCEKIGLRIDRSNFFPIGSSQILQLFDGVSRLINHKDTQRAITDNGRDGIHTISNLEFNIDKESTNPLDNITVTKSDNIFIINISTFMTKNSIDLDKNNFYQYDLREPINTMTNPKNIQHIKLSNKNVETIVDKWTNIPYNKSNHIKHNDHENEQINNKQINNKQNITHQPINKYSPSYAKSIGYQSKSQPSVNIKLGGVY
jgi:hypothetical protein